MAYERKPNTGALFQPRSSVKLAFMGKVDVDGDERELAVIFVEDRDGNRHRIVFERVGKLFVNDKKGNDAAPDLSGPINHPFRLSAWANRTRDDDTYLGIAVSERDGGGGGGGGGGDRERDRDRQAEKERQDLDDDIPF